MPITDYLRHNAAAYGNEIALVEINPEVLERKHVTWRDYDLIESTDPEPYRREITWSVFDEKANRFANLLLSRGVKKGDKVAILLMNCLEWLPIYFGILKSGATAVPLNFRYTAEEIAYCVKQADVDILVFGPQFTGRVEEIVDDISHGRLLFYVGEDCPTFAENYRELTANCPSSDPAIPLNEDEDAAIYFSSGTTGFPKAILHHHRSLTQAAEMEQNHHGQTHDDTFLCIPPLYHTGAKMHWFGSLISGSRAVLLRGVTPQSIFDAVSDEHCTIVWLLVPWVQDILLAIEEGTIDPANYELNQWRLMHIGAQPVPQSLIRRWKEIFPAHQYDTNYGLSESTGPGCVHLGVENIDHVGAIGVPGYRWVAKICDDHGEEVPDGEVGELWVKGPGVMVCYYNNPEMTEQKFYKGFLYTGDVGTWDENEFVTVRGRKDDMIVSAGENIYPPQIEAVLNDHPKVAESAVIGAPDKLRGEVVAAYVVPSDPSLTVEELKEYCTNSPMLSSYKWPRIYNIVDSLPHTATGKIMHRALRKQK